MKNPACNWDQTLENAFRISTLVREVMSRVQGNQFLWRYWFPRSQKVSFWHDMLLQFSFLIFSLILSDWNLRWFLNNELRCIAGGFPRSWLLWDVPWSFTESVRTWFLPNNNNKKIFSAQNQNRQPFIAVGRNRNCAAGKPQWIFRCIALTTRLRLSQHEEKRKQGIYNEFIKSSFRLPKTSLHCLYYIV